MEMSYLRIKDVTGIEHLQATDGSTYKIYKAGSADESIYLKGADGQGIKTLTKNLKILTDKPIEANVQNNPTSNKPTAVYNGEGAMIGGLLHDAVQLYMHEDKETKMGINFDRIKEIMTELVIIRRGYK